MRNNYRNMFFAGYGYSNQHQNSPPSPTRASVWGSVYSPFRTTSMPLQDITMNQTLPLTNGTNPRSPGAPCPTGVTGTRDGTGIGRTMKEYEDQLETLKKENFNLKLRIYFLEERMGITSVDENAIKKNIELKVEIESLRKELVEKQELLSQAAKAFELIEEQKEASSRNQAQYQQSLENEREKIRKLEQELAEYQEKVASASIYYKETFGITPEKALENEEKLRQMEELVASLENEVKQVTNSLEEERIWAQELESERDEFRERLDAETRLRENLTAERVRDTEELREKVKDLEEQLLKRDAVVQQCRNELLEKERIIKEKNAQLEEKSRAYEEVNAVSEKRKKQVDQLRASVKTRDDALTDLNNKHRALLSQFENGYTKRSPPSSPLAMNSIEDPLQSRMGQKITSTQGMTKKANTCLDWEPNKERSTRVKSPVQFIGEEIKDEVEDRDSELKRQEEARKQLVLKLCNMQKHAETTDYKLRKLEGEHEKAIKTIQGFMERQQQLENTNLRKEQKIMELEIELHRLRECENLKTVRDGHNQLPRRDYSTDMTDDPERDPSNQQRFDEMEAKINDLRDQIETIKAEKSRLEKQIEVESEELQGRLQDREQKIEVLEVEKLTIIEQLQDKISELEKVKEAARNDLESSIERENLLRELQLRNEEIEEKNRKIEQLSKDLQVKTQNLQKLVNTELWSKNKEIAKLHNHITVSYSHDRSRNKSDIMQESTSTQLSTLIKKLNDIGIKVTFTNEVIQLNYVNGNEPIDVKTMTDYVQKLVAQKNELEKEVDYLKWLKLVSKPDIATEIDEYGDNQTERAQKYCELLRTHLKDLMKFMKEVLKNVDRSDTIGNEHKKIVLDVLMNSKILSDDFVNALEGISINDLPFNTNEMNIKSIDNSVKKSRSENLIAAVKNQASTQSDSEAFSEPDRTVSMARIGLQETQQKSLNRSRFTKYTKTFTDSEDSLEYVPYHKTYQNDVNDCEASHQIQELKETNALLYSELSALRNELTAKISFGYVFDDKISPLITKLEKSQKFCEKLQSSLERRMHEFHMLKKESKQNSTRRAQLEKKLVDLETMAAEMNKQKDELVHYKENAERKTTEMLITLNRENDMLRMRIKKLEDENEAAKANISTLTKELDHLTLSHSQILVENTKLTNEKLRLEQEVRKTECRYDATIRSMHDKFNKEISDLNQINESHRVRLQELEIANKELRRHVAVCDASDSAPSSSGISSIPGDTILKQTCEDVMQEYQSYNNSQYWIPLSYPTLGGRSKSSCSPDLGIESDAAVTTIRPLKDTLKITESMANLLSDDDDNGNRPLRELDSDSPLPLEGLNEMETLKQENETLKRRLMKTRRALEDTFQHLSASNKNKKNVEKAITKQLQITKSILKKTRTYEEPLDN
ncbi:phosphodiesterase 4D interacting protein centrosomin isoform X2 [Calliopsis andreniformis]|uniref:phosphodiesterase 4D interacting protein centrosomin isoform X2 n=1 Tax=Calliopsis andreniformis TaxID=337506 RepID=UPI003FCD6147